MADVVTVIYFSFLPSRDPVPGPGQPGRSTGTAAVGWCERRTVLYDLWTCACSSRVLIDVLEQLAAYPLVTLPGESAAPIRGLYRLKVQILLECWRCICPSLRRISSRLIAEAGRAAWRSVYHLPYTATGQARGRRRPHGRVCGALKTVFYLKALHHIIECWRSI